MHSAAIVNFLGEVYKGVIVEVSFEENTEGMEPSVSNICKHFSTNNNI
jgi:hypothetical protein